VPIPSNFEFRVSNLPSDFPLVPRLFRKGRFKPWDVALALFLAGCVPTLLMAVISYSILRGTLESSIVRDRHTLVVSLARLINSETSRPGEMLEYYRTNPLVQQYMTRAPGDPEVQAWISDAFYSHPRLDGMFITDADGKLIDSIPAASPEQLGQEFSTAEWLSETRQRADYYVSPVYPRIPDKRLCASIVTAVKGKNGDIIGYIGANILVERVGKRLAALNFGEQARAQVIDQTGKPLFDENLQPNLISRPEDPALLKTLDQTTQEQFRWNSDLVNFQKIEGAKWIALLRQPISVAYQPVWDLVGKEAVIAAWLVALYLVGSWLMSWLYHNHIESSERIARETSFSQTILAHMPIGIALLDSASRKVLEANEKFLEMAREFGGAPADRSLTDLHLRDLPNLGIDDAVERVNVSGRAFQTREQTVQDAAQRTHFLSVNLLRLQDAKDRTHGVLVLMEDATHEVETRRDLIAANTAKDQFLALLSHELRNPLSPVITMVSELDKMTDLPEARNALEIIRRNVELEARLIDDLLDITRIAHGKLQLTPETIDAHRAIHRALEICQRDIDSKHLEVRLDLAASAFHVKADPARFQQVLWNLIKNAVKFTPRGSITISSVNNGSGRIVVEVADTGIGITPERLARIFKPFEQGESSITRRFGGLGLGLAISKAMIEAHGGVLRARSAGIDEGATFTVELGTVEAPAKVEEVLRTPVIAGGTLQHKILLVDDHEDTCTGMRMILERRGYRVKTAHDVQSALEVAEDYPFELIISDLGLPDGTGFDLMKELRRRRGDSIRGVALSGFGMESDIERSMEAGFEVHLIKPVNLERLSEILRRVFPPAELETAGKV
jgi:signal transduction histidine kinase/ActR/RegA family two-component response regulator